MMYSFTRRTFTIASTPAATATSAASAVSAISASKRKKNKRIARAKSPGAIATDTSSSSAAAAAAACSSWIYACSSSSASAADQQVLQQYYQDYYYNYEQHQHHHHHQQQLAEKDHQKEGDDDDEDDDDDDVGGENDVIPVLVVSPAPQNTKPKREAQRAPAAMEFIELIKAPRVDNVVMRRALFKTIEGTLCITGHHLILSSRKQDAEELWLLHKNIDVVERKPSTFGGGTVVIKCKDFAVINLDVNSTDDFNNVADSLDDLSYINVPSLSYPFFYRPLFPTVEDGWTAFSTEAEFSKLVLTSEDWRISQVNKDYAVCKSYPATVVVPKSIPDEDIVVASSFRQGGRFPILCYRHENGTVLLRSGQPLVGPAGRRCKEDERLINAVLGPGKRGYIIDTRTQTLAQTAKAIFDWQSKGGGFELEVYYPQWRRVHKPIDRHYNLLDSLAKLMEACNDTTCTMDKWLSRLESSGWLTNVSSVLNCAALIAQSLVQENTSVLVHGSDGTDTTLAVTSLTQIILNPDCRSIRGFEALIEREWLQGGYPFGTRHFKSGYAYTASSARNNPKKTYAPTFLLFMDCVYQLFTQFPCSFEFTETFLISLVQHSYASQFGTFLCDSVCEREELDLKNKTVSLWSYINRPDALQSYMNPVYEPNSKVIWPSVAPVSLTLWSGMFLRWVVDQSPTKDTWFTITDLKEREREMKREAIRLRKQLLDMEKAIIAKRASESISTPTTTTTNSSSPL